MTYTSKEIQQFEAYINDVKFNREMFYNTTRWLLDIIDDTVIKDVNYPSAFIRDLSDSLEYVFYKYDLTLEEIEQELADSILTKTELTDIQFTIFGSERGFEVLNEKLLTNEYNF